MSQNINDQSSPTVSLRTVGIELPLIATEPLTSGPVAINPEFPGFANIFESTGEAEIHSPTPNRREFIALSSAAITLAAVGCRRPDLEILPYSQTPDNIIPGIPLYYASAMPRPGGCAALLIETHEGRPTKIEGNPKHPASQGATDAQAQAAILDLYSPDRSKQVLKKSADGLQPKSWEEFDAFAFDHFAKLRKEQGTGLAFLTENTPSPSLRLLREHAKSRFPNALWSAYEPTEHGNARDGTRSAFGQPLIVTPDFAKAYRIVSLDCDFLGVDCNEVANGKAYASRRRPAHADHEPTPADVSRLYVLESAYSVTGTMADHRLRIPAAHVADYAVALAKEVATLTGASIPAALQQTLKKLPEPGVTIPELWIKEVARDLVAFKGKSLIVVGDRQPAIVHALAVLLNQALGSTAVSYRPIVEDEYQSIAELAKAIGDEKVKTLVILGGNPAFNAPADLGLADKLDKVPTVIRLGMFVDETSAKAHWHLPRSHFLECWGDTETLEGIHTAIQPMIAPLHPSRSDLELLIQLSGYENASTYADAKLRIYPLVRKAWAKKAGADDELSFKKFIQEGFIHGSERPPVTPNLDAGSLGTVLAKYKPATTVTDKNLEVTFHTDYSIGDGRFAWNSWLLELPDPLTKLVWDNAALISPGSARRLGIQRGEMLEITVDGSSVKVPAFIQPGQADGSIALHLGYGKLRPGRVDLGGGFDVYPIRKSGQLAFAPAKVVRAGGSYDLVVTQEHGTIPEDKKEDIIREYVVHEHHDHSAEQHHDEHHHEEDPTKLFQWGYDTSLYKDAGRGMRRIRKIALAEAQDLSFPQRLEGSMQWGMVVDLNTCTGCSACMIACQAENNIPVVGKHEVKLNREMHWISLHRYFMQGEGPVTGGLEQAPAEDPTIVSQPMMCQHCEAAPCESVCPVNATVHSPEGLNLQVYNRCIGTRYCSNNCPYKARRFNWFDFNKRRIDELRIPTPFSEAGMPETLKMQKNPEVTVRMRGVMEKCTYCIQRTERAKTGAKVLAIKAGADKADTAETTDAKQEYKQGYAIRNIDGKSSIIVPDGIVRTACEQACPTGAIVFGNVRDLKSKVYALKNKKDEPDYLVQGELNTKPRTSYLPRWRNLNPAMKSTEAAPAKGAH